MNKKIEILAPAGSYEHMRAAMNAGCDAVYIGGSNFGARAYAENPDEENLLQAIDEAHIRGKKIYLTVNTLLKEKELANQLYNFLENYYLRGLDAVIVQDVGVLHFIHRNFPDLPIHASTQMTLTMANGAELLKEYGVTRLVASRELSLKEIKAISCNTDLELEVFVHGALCYCYSGQCLMSSIIGGRSGNRGRCAQPCRMPYRLSYEQRGLRSSDEIYLLSPKDINTLEIIPELVEAGIDSFKIEGRMKSFEYAAATSYMYRKYLDLYFKLGAEGYREYISGSQFRDDMISLQDIYNRGGFSLGYAKSYHGKQMMSLNRPNHSGVLVGKVKAVGKDGADVILNGRLNAQDVLEVRRGQEKIYEYTIKDAHDPGEILRIKLPVIGKLPAKVKKRDSGSMNAKLAMGSVKIGDEVYRIRNNALLDYLSEEYVKKDAKYPIKGRLRAKLGQRLSLSLSYEGVTVEESSNIVEAAKSQPIALDRIRTQLEKTGDSFFYFEELTIDADDSIFIPVASINELRRNAIAKLEKKVAESFRRTSPLYANGKRTSDSERKDEIELRSEVAYEPDIKADMDTERVFISADSMSEAESLKIDNEKLHEIKNATCLHADKKTQTCSMVVSVQNMSQWKTALVVKEISAIYALYESFDKNDMIYMAEDTSKEGKDFYLVLPHICRMAVYKKLEKDLSDFADNDKIKGYVVKNFEEIALLKSLYKEKNTKKQIILNYNMYVYNKEAKDFWNEQGISHFTAPVELNLQELRELGISDCDALVYGYLPLMVSAQCVFDNTVGCMKNKVSENNSDEETVSGVLTDRMNKKFFARAYCKTCYNVIYNGQPLALHKQADEIFALSPKNYRLDFTIESDEQMRKVLNIFINRYCYGRDIIDTLDNYTTGHFKRGIL